MKVTDAAGLEARNKSSVGCAGFEMCIRHRSESTVKNMNLVLERESRSINLEVMANRAHI